MGREEGRERKEERVEGGRRGERKEEREEVRRKQGRVVVIPQGYHPATILTCFVVEVPNLQGPIMATCHLERNKSIMVKVHIESQVYHSIP